MFHFLDGLTITDLLTLLADLFNFLLLVATIIAVTLTYRQLKDGFKTQKATFFKELYLAAFTDPDIRDGYHLIEYEQFVYDNDHFQDSKTNEYLIDRLLSFFNVICDLYNQKILTKYEMEIFRYQLLRVYQNPGIRRYVAFLKVFYLTIGVKALPYGSFFSYCEKEQSKLQYTKRLSIDQAYWFYKEQKSKLDKIFALAARELPSRKDDESNLEHQIRILAEVQNRFQYPDKFDQGDIIYKAIQESAIYDPARIIDCT